MEPEPLCPEDPRRRAAEGPGDRGTAPRRRARLREEGDEGLRRLLKGRLPGQGPPREMVPVHSSRAPMSRSGWQEGNSTGYGSNPPSPAAPPAT
ncbi:hypothetical protein [Methanoculleus chikugoensis]|uniref:hypothetical protein n=1 Tax=Methanoculleus chikugoensis TaxID=118126 RepID=UPI001FB48902|nr:hypothetical protein [Methanoculleus chikugoensis]